MKPNIIKDFNLPPYTKGKSFSEAAKAIEKKFEGREGDEARRTKEELLARVAKAQEYTKMQEGLKANSTEVPDMMNGQIPEGVNPHFVGGMLMEQGSKGQMGVDGAIQGAATGMSFGGPIGAAIGGAVGLGAGLIGGGIEEEVVKHGPSIASNDFASGGPVDPTKKLGKKDVDAINSTTGLAMNDSLVNRLFERTTPADPNLAPDPINFGKYKDVGYFEMANPEGDRPMITNTKKNPHNADTIGQVEKELRDLNPGVDFGLKFNSYAKGGFTNDFAGGGRPTVSTVNSLTQQGKTGQPGLTKWANTGTPDLNIAPGMGSKLLGLAGAALPQLARLAPVASNAKQLNDLEKTAPVTLDRLDARYQPNQVDERALVNQVQNEATSTSRALANATNGSAGALKTNLVASQLAKTNALSNAYLQTKQMNNAENSRGQQFNASVDAQNLRQGTIETQINDQNEGAYNSAKSALTSQLATDIGNFGKERVNMKQVAEMFGYKWDGTYMVDKDGKKYTPEQVKEMANKSK